MRVGVLALQGAFREHILSVEALGVSAVPVRLPGQLEGLAGLIMPGGESTAIGKLMRSYGFYEAIREYHDNGMAVWGTCAGAILMAGTIADAAAGQESLELMDCVVQRNAYGRQVDSFQVDLAIEGIEGAFPGVFIRAPIITWVGAGVRVIGRHEGSIVAAREGDLLATTFHPELTGDVRLHRYFVESVIGAR